MTLRICDWLLTIIQIRKLNSLQILIFWGQCAGKSNLLEAIYYLGHGRSYRLVPGNQVLQWDRHSFVIQAAFSGREAGWFRNYLFVTTRGKSISIMVRL